MKKNELEKLLFLSEENRGSLLKENEELKKKVEEQEQLLRSCSQFLIKENAIISNSEAISAYYMPRLRDDKREKFYAVLLDSIYRIIREELVSIGSLNFSVVHPREVFAPAIREAAASIFLVHNHPSGDPTPSRKDIQVTIRLVEVGEVVGIDILDHIIVGNGSYFSFLKEHLGGF